VRPRAARVDQADHGHDDHRPQGGLGQVLEQRGQEQQGEDHDQGGGDAGELAAGARPAVDGRLGQAPAGREAWKQPPARLAVPSARSSWSASTSGSSGAAKARAAAIDSTKARSAS
jgi:hypothetical protein